MTSVGWRSGVHWIARRVAPSIERGDRAGEHGLGGAGHVLEQNVAAAEERAQDELIWLRLPSTTQLDVVEQPLGQLGRGGELRGRLDVLPEDLVLQLGLRQDPSLAEAVLRSTGTFPRCSTRTRPRSRIHFHCPLTAIVWNVCSIATGKGV